MVAGRSCGSSMAGYCLSEAVAVVTSRRKGGDRSDGVDFQSHSRFRGRMWTVAVVTSLECSTVGEEGEQSVGQACVCPLARGVVRRKIRDRDSLGNTRRGVTLDDDRRRQGRKGGRKVGMENEMFRRQTSDGNSVVEAFVSLPSKGRRRMKALRLTSLTCHPLAYVKEDGILLNGLV